MADALPPPGVDNTVAPADELVARIAAIDDYMAGQGSREAVDAEPPEDLAPEVFAGLIDTVLLLRQSAAADGVAPPVGPPDAPRHIGRYEIVGRAGEGGFATVWEAWDPLLRRRVALKVRRPEALLSASARRRFVREAEIASRLVHPHIVTIYEVAADAGREYIAQEFCAGGSLAAWLERHPGPLDPRSAARIVSALARAVAQAHQDGVIHRDIKPANVLLVPVTAGHEPLIPAAAGDEAAGFTVKLADFGLGKAAEESSERSLTRLTHTGASLGTPAWMAPEQVDAAFGPVGPATDVHGLGLVLDRLLTGRMLRGGGTTAETYREVLFEDVRPADRVVPGVPRDLGAVCLQCLAKRPANRYGSATALAADLERWLAGHPTVARPLSAAARVGRAFARRPLLTALAVVALAAAGLAGWAILERGRAARRALAQQQEIGWRDAAAELRRGFEALRAGNVAASVAHAAAARRLDPRHTDAFASRWLERRMHGERAILIAHPTTAAADRPRDLYAIALAPGGRTCALAGADGGIRLVRGLDGTPTTTVIPSHDEVNAVCFSGDGGMLAAVGQDGRVCWWRMDDATLVPAGECRPGPGPLYAVAFTADGRGMAVGGEDRVVRLVPLDGPAEPRELFRFEPPAGENPEVESLVAVSGGRMAASCGDAVVLLDAADGGVLHEFHRPLLGNRKAVLGSLTVSPDGTRLMACGTDAQAHVWDIATGTLVTSLPSHPAWVQGCSFSPDGSQVATACRDGGVRVFAIDTAAQVNRFVGHVGRVWSIAFEPGGTLLTAGADGTLRRWDPRVAPDMTPLREVAVPGRKLTRLARAPAPGVAGERTVVAVDPVDATWLVDVQSGSVIPLRPTARGIREIAFDPDRQRLAVGGPTPLPIAVTTFVAGEPRTTQTVALPTAVSALCWSPGGGLLAADRSGTLFHAPPTLDGVAAVAALADPVHGLAAAPTGPPRVAAAGRKTAIVPLGTPGRAEPIWLEIGEDSWSVAWSPDAALLAVGTRTGRVLLFDGLTGEARGGLTAHERLIEGLAFSADGHSLVTADTGCVRLSDVATLTTFDELRPAWQVFAIRLLPDDSGLVIAGSDAETTRHAVARLAVMEFGRP
jgi:WD40 repeat protein/tRNA A-37 threonylcarbamoyl transferase component Bud32